MRVLITGGAGFIGTAATRSFIEHGHDVVVADRLGGERQRRNACELGGADLHVVDLATADLRPLVDGVDVVVHLAGQAGVQTSWAAGFRAHLRDNVEVTQRLLDAVGAGGPRVVIASSSSVYGAGAGASMSGGASGGRLAEDTPANPVSPYGAAKAAVEHLARVYAGRGVEVVLLRYFTVYGRRQRPDMAIQRMIEAGLGGRPFPVRGDGAQVRDMTHVDDVVRATVRSAVRPLPSGAAINVASGQPVALGDVLRTVERELGRPVPLRRVPAVPGDPPRTAADVSRAADLLGWRPEMTLAEGVADQVGWSLRVMPARQIAM